MPETEFKTDQSTQSNATPTQTGSLFIQLLVNFVIPTLILVYFKKDTFLGNYFDTWITDSKSFNKIALLIALAFPIVYGCLDFFDRRKLNFFSVIGTVSIALTGGMGVLEIDPKYIAIKEAAVPGLLGVLTLVSLKTRFPVVKSLVFNRQIMHVDKIEQALRDQNATGAFEKSLTKATFILAGSFFLSATTNYFLAVILLVSPPGTEAFNQEMGRMIAWSFPVNSVPAYIVLLIAVFYTYRSIVKFTHLTFEEILNLPEETQKKLEDS